MGSRSRGRVSRTAVSVGIVVVALVLSTAFVYVGALVASGSRTDVPTFAVVLVTFAELGFVAAAALFLLVSDHGREYVRVALPDGRDRRYAVGGVLAAYAIAVTAVLLSRAMDGSADLFSAGDLGTTGEAGSTGEFGAAGGLTGGEVEVVLLALAVVSVLVIGPSEELLFRGVVQRYLSGAFSQVGAIVVSSVLFAAVHAPTFFLAASGPTRLVAAGAIFAISVMLGYVYAVTDNLFVPTVVHGVYDATLFGAVYVGLQLGLL